jgi:hypothetical protein
MQKWSQPLLEAQVAALNAGVAGDHKTRREWQLRAARILADLQRHALIVMLDLQNESPDNRPPSRPYGKQMLEYLARGQGGLTWRQVPSRDLVDNQVGLPQGVLPL